MNIFSDQSQSCCVCFAFCLNIVICSLSSWLSCCWNWTKKSHPANNILMIRFLSIFYLRPKTKWFSTSISDYEMIWCCLVTIQQRHVWMCVGSDRLNAILILLLFFVAHKFVLVIKLKEVSVQYWRMERAQTHIPNTHKKTTDKHEIMYIRDR